MKSKALIPQHFIYQSIRIAICFIFVSLLPLFASAVDLLSVPGPSFSPPASAGGDSYVSAVSADGRYVLFNSSANNLTHRTNGLPYLLPHPAKMNAFVHDRVLGTTTVVSVDPTDTWTGDADSTVTAISTNGQFVLFESGSHNLVPGAALRTNSAEIYMRDVVNKTTTWVTTRLSPISRSGATFSVMTPDARYVAFSSGETNLTLVDTNTAQDVFVRDLSSGETKLLSAGIPGFNSFFAPVITPDGKFVAFQSSMLSVNNTQDVYVCDIVASNTFCLSTNAHQFISGVPACYGQEISQDGKYVVYEANANVLSPTIAYIFRHNLETGTAEVVTSNAFPATGTQPLDISPDGRFIAFIGKTNGHAGIFLWDGSNGTTTYVSVSTNGAISPNLVCDSPAIDTTGRFVSFSAVGDNLVTNSLDLNFHIFRRDMQSGVTELVDAGLDGNATNRAINSDFYMSADGKAVVFDSPDTDLVEQDGNGASDVFVRDFDSEATELASSSDSSMPTQTGGHSDRRSRARVSADGHFAVFFARGEDLVPGQTNRFRQVFVRDLVNQSNILVSADTNGLGNADGSATECAISGDGRYVAFTSLADNLVPNDANHVSDIFLRDMQTGKTTLVSTNAFGTGSANDMSTSPNISTDGRYVTYTSMAGDIVPLLGPHIQNLFVYDQVLRTNYILTTNGAPSFATTPDGRYVVFDGSLMGGTSANLYVWDSQLRQRIFTNVPANSVSSLTISTNGQWIAFLLGSPASASLRIIDRLTKSNITVSAGLFGSRPNPRFSADGRYLVYSTIASNSSQDTNLLRDVYVFDVLTRSNSLVSRSFVTGQAPNGNSDFPDISADGRFISYQSDAPDIVPQDNNGRIKDIFVYDRQSGSTMLLSASIYQAGTADYVSQLPGFTADGQTVTFQSWASDMTVNDFNQSSDLYLFKILNASNSTNPPPVLTGQILFNPGSGAGVGSGQTSPQITWAAAPGVGYQLQYKTNLTDDAWLPVNGSVVIQNGVGYANDLAPDSDHRFYRIVGY